MIQEFQTGTGNELVNMSRNDLLTVAGALTNHPTSLAINGQAATIYGDLTFATTNGFIGVN